MEKCSISKAELVYTKVLLTDWEQDLALLKAENYESEHFYPIGSFNETTDTSTQLNEELMFIKQRDTVIIPGFPNASFNIVIGNIKANDVFVAPIVPEGFLFSFERILVVSEVGITDSPGERIYNLGGMSGSPVFSQDTHLMGVAILGDLSATRIFFTPIKKLQDLINKDRGYLSHSEIQKRLEELYNNKNYNKAHKH